MDKVVEILIAVNSKLAGLEQTIAGLNAGKSAATALGSSLQSALSIDLVSRFNSGLSAMATGLKDSVMAGVKFNATVQDATLGVAAVLKAFNGARFGSFDDALRESAKQVERLKEAAKTSPATFEQLLQGYQSLASGAAAAGIEMEKQVQLVVMLSQGMKGLGVATEQLAQEGNALLSGNITADSVVAKKLQITREQIEAAKEAGTLMEFLTAKFAPFTEAAERGSKSYSQALSNLEDSLTQLKGQAFAPVFEQLRVGILSVTESLAKPEVVAALGALGEQIGNVVKYGLQLTQWAIEHASAVKTVAQYLAVLATSYAALRITSWAAGIVVSTVSWLAQGKAIDAVTAALGRKTAAEMAANGGKVAGIVGGVNVGMVTNVGMLLGAAVAGAIVLAMKAEVDRIEHGAKVAREFGAQYKDSIAAIRDGDLEAEKSRLARLSQDALMRAADASARGETALMKQLEDQAQQYMRLREQAEEIARVEKERLATQEASAVVAERTASQRVAEALRAGEEMNLLRAQATGDEQRIEAAQEAKTLAEALLAVEKQGVTNAEQKREIAQEMILLQQTAIALENEKKAAELATELKINSGNSGARMQGLLEQQARLQKQLRRDRTTAAPELPPLPGPESMETLTPEADEATSDVLPPLDAIPSTPAPAGRSERAKRSVDDAQVRLKLQQVEKQIAEEREQSERRTAEFKERQLAAAQNALDPLKETTTEVERQQLIAAKIRELEEAHKDDLASGKRTRAEIVALAEQEVRNDELARDAQKAKSGGLKEDKRTLTQLKEEYAEIARIISQIEGSTLIPQSQKAGIANVWRTKQRGNLAAQAGQGEDVRAEQQSLAGQQQDSDTANSFGGQFQSGLVQWTDSLGTAGENAAGILTGTLQPAMDGLNESIYGLVTGTGDWNKVWQQAGASALKSVIDLTTKTALHYAIVAPLQAAFFATGEAQKATETATSISQSAAKTAAATPNATLQSIGSYGVAAVVGLAAVVAAMAAVRGGFAHGGYTGDGAKYQPAGVVHRGEYVMTKETTARLGVGYLDSLQVNTGRGYSGGGAVDAVMAMPESERRGRNVQVTVVHSEEALRRVVNDHPDTEHRVIRTVAANRGRFGV